MRQPTGQWQRAVSAHAEPKSGAITSQRAMAYGYVGVRDWMPVHEQERGARRRQPCV